MALELDRRVTSAGAEELIARLAPDPPGELRLGVDHLERFELLAESRFLALLNLMRRGSIPIVLETTWSLEADRRRSKSLAAFFTDTLAGVVLAQLASSVVDSSKEDRRSILMRLQADHATGTEGFFGFGREQAAPIVDIFGGPAPAAMVTDKSGTEFDPLFRSWVAKLNLPVLSDWLVSALVEFAYESFDNCRRHGSRSLDRAPLEGVRFVLMRSLLLKDGRLEQVVESSAPQIGRYLDRVASTLSRSDPVVELTIADSGVGVPATLRESLAVYDGPWSEECEVTKKAFLPGTSRRRSAAGVGRGLFKALRSAEALGGLVSLRTGRTQLFRDYAAGQVREWDAEELNFVPGTSISLLFPWREPAPTLFSQ